MLALSLALSLVQETQVRGVGPTTPAARVLSATYARRHALVIGIDQYDDPAFPDLSHAVADAQAVAKKLVEKHGFASEDVLLLENATEEDIDRSIEDWACDSKRVGPDDLVVVFYAGHGYNRPLDQGVRAYFVPSDAAMRDGIPLWSTLVSMEDLQGVAEAIPAKHALFILDCCFGGWITTRAASSTQPGLTSVARQVLTAGNENQQVLDAGGDGHSVFAQALLEALDGQADRDVNGVVSFGELYEYVHGTVQQRAASLQQQQTPGMATLRGHRGGSVAFFMEPGQPLAEQPQEVEAPHAGAVTTFLSFALNPTLYRAQAQAALDTWREPILRGEAPPEVVEAALRAVCQVEVDLPKSVHLKKGLIRFSHRGGLPASTLLFRSFSLTVDGETRFGHDHDYGYSEQDLLAGGSGWADSSFAQFGFPPLGVGRHELSVTVGIDLFRGDVIHRDFGSIGLRFGSGDPQDAPVDPHPVAFHGGVRADGLPAAEPLYRVERVLGPYVFQIDPLVHTKVEGEHLGEAIREVIDLQGLEITLTGTDPALMARIFVKRGSSQPVAVSGRMNVHLDPETYMEVPFYSWIQDDDFDMGIDIGGCPTLGGGGSGGDHEGLSCRIPLGGPGTVLVNRDAWLRSAGTQRLLAVEIVSDDDYVNQLTDCLGRSAVYWEGVLRYEVPVSIQ